MKYNILHIIPLLMLMGCSGDELITEEPDGRPILFAWEMGLGFSSESYSNEGRASSPDPQSAKAILPETVGLFGDMEGYPQDIFYNQIVYRKDGTVFADTSVSDPVYDQLNGSNWPQNNNWIYAPLKYWSGTKPYQFYCYAPHSSMEGTTVNLTSNSYGAMTSFRISNIRPYSPYDYTVADCYKYWDSGTVPFNMRHISARICIRLAIGKEYAKMRKIKIKEVSVNDRKDGGTYFLCAVTLNSEDPKDNTIEVTSSGAYTPSSDPAEILIIPIFDDSDGLELNCEKYQQFGSLYVMPQAISNLTVNIKYDVYDNINDTEPTRVDQRVTNTVLFKDPSTGSPTRIVKSGKYYEINILVSPKYLYVLSDNDIKPDMLISPEE